MDTIEYKVVYVKWQEFNCDPRQYKPSNPKFVPENVQIAIQVPVQYVYEMDGLTTILTPEGMRFVIDALENVMQDKPTTNTGLNTYSDEDFE